MLMASLNIGRFHAPLGGEARIKLTVANSQSLVVFRQSLVALAFKVQHAAEVDMRPGQQPLFLTRGKGFLEVINCFVRMASHQIDAGENEMSSGCIGRGSNSVGLAGECLLRHRSSRGNISTG